MAYKKCNERNICTKQSNVIKMQTKIFMIKNKNVQLNVRQW